MNDQREAPIVRFYDYYFTLDGVKISYQVLWSLVNPPKDKLRLYSIERDGDQMVVGQYYDAKAASKYYEKGQTSETRSPDAGNS